MTRLAWAALAFLTACAADPAKDLADGIKLHLIQRHPDWSAVDCRRHDGEARHFLSCGPVLSDRPAVWMLDPRERVVWAMNGPAIEWSGDSAETRFGEAFPIRRWTGPPINFRKGNR